MKGFDESKFESFVFEKMSKAKIPGLSVVLVKDGELIYSRGFGFRDVERGLEATPNTIYGIGSVTKSFTALAIMQLVEEGKLNLEDPLEKYLPLKMRPKDEPIRIVNLLTHSSGIPALGYAEAFIRNVIGEEATWIPMASYEDMLAFLSGAEEWAEAKPGLKFFYLNEGYVLLGYIVEKVSGMRYEDYVKRKILSPLNMNRSYFSEEEVGKDPEVAVPYLLTKDGKRVRSAYPFGITADGGLLSNVLDLSRYLTMYLNRGSYGEAQLLSKEGIEEMEKPRIEVPYRLLGNESYGLGWIITPNFLGHKLVGHSGSVLVSTAYAGYLPGPRIGVAVLANSSGYSLSHIGAYALALALGKDPERALPFIKRERIMERLTGRYEAYKGTIRAEVVQRGAMLYLEIKGKYTELIIPLVPEELSEEYARFKVPQLTGWLEAEFKINGEEVTLIYERYKLKRVGPI